MSNPRQVNPFLFYFRSIGNLAVTRSLPIHAISLQWAFHSSVDHRHQIPAVTLKAHTAVATLNDRTLQGRHAVWRKCMSSLQNAIEVAGACEERIQRNDNVYLPVFSQSRGYQYIRKSDVYLPALLLILALVLLLIGTVRSVVHDDP